MVRDREDTDLPVSRRSSQRPEPPELTDTRKARGGAANRS